MDDNRMMMKGKKAELEQRQTELRIKAGGQLRQLAGTLNPALREIEEMDIPLAAQVMDDLVMLQAELLTIASKLDRLQGALHG